VGNLIQLAGKEYFNSKKDKLMVIIFVLPEKSMCKPIGGFRVVNKYGSRLAARGHPVNAIHPLMFFPEERDLRDKRKIFSPSMSSPILGVLEFKWFGISLKE